jgi:1-aminocyclopropane-1-carboxylate deaminase
LISLEIGEPFPVSIEKNSVKLTLLNDWNTPFTLGTKLRKAEGFYFQLLKSNKKAVQIAGDPNSNFMAAFTLYFYSKGIPVLSIHSSRSGYKGGNKILSERFAYKKINLQTISQEFYFKPHSFFLKSPYNHINFEESDILVIPRWGVSHLVSQSLNTLWNHIFKKYNINILYVDVGSGLTYLSLLNYTLGLKIRVVGICIGLPQKKMVRYLEEMEYREFGKISSYDLIDPLELGRFGKKNSTIYDFMGEMREKNIILEPIYSAKSVYMILHDTVLQDGVEGLFYLHQGGLLSNVTHEG